MSGVSVIFLFTVTGTYGSPGSLVLPTVSRPRGLPTPSSMSLKVSTPVGLQVSQLSSHSRNQKAFSAGLLEPPRATAFDTITSLFGGSDVDEKRQAAKQTLFNSIEGLGRGVNANEAQKAAVDNAARALERLNPNKKSLSSNEVNGEWELIYTTSASILGTGKLPPFRPWGPIYQTIDAANLRARNRETWPFFNAVEAELTPTNATNVNVQFKLFRIFGLVPVKAPEAAKGQLDVTYVDNDLRVSRGDKGNLFVLVMSNPDTRLTAPADLIQTSNAFFSVCNCVLIVICFFLGSGMALYVLKRFRHSVLTAGKEPLLLAS